MLNFQRYTSYFLVLISYLFLTSCSVSKQIAKSANEDVLSNKALTAAHVGISICDPAANKDLYNYQGDKDFVPASNTKLPTCYVPMKYLGDSLVGLRYNDTLDFTAIKGTGEPTFLHPDFKNQPVYEFLKKGKRKILISESGFSEQPLGSGWAWNDFREYYMAERRVRYLFEQVENGRRWVPAGEILAAVYGNKESGRSRRMQNLFSGNTFWEDYIVNNDDGEYGFNLE